MAVARAAWGDCSDDVTGGVHGDSVGQRRFSSEVSTYVLIEASVGLAARRWAPSMTLQTLFTMLPVSSHQNIAARLE